MMVFPIALGFFLGGLVDYYIPREYISKYLARKKKRTILYSVALGFLASACSHGILALSMELHKKGASGPSVVSFLLASPWANLPVTILLIGFFGLKGVLIIVAALLIAIVTGLIFQVLSEKGWIEENQHTIKAPDDFSIAQDLSKRFRGYQFTFQNLMKDTQGIARGIYELADMVLWWLVLGVLLASFAIYVPHHIFEHFLGPSFLGLLATLILATVLEVCSEGTSPLAFEIYKQTGAFGNAFAFLMGGVVTDFTEVGLIWVNLGKKTALWFLLLTIPQVIFFGWLFNLFF
ncbi:MAG: permease, partial [Candidatus Omnitrophica bacterium]|nr:permease [Candidatus Omnitrophota bacterium]